MTSLRTAAALVAATLLNGSVALAMAPSACSTPVGAVCAVPLTMTVAPPARPAHLAARAALQAGVLPASMTLPSDEPSRAEIAPPRRPADLPTRRAAPTVGIEAETGRAEVAPPRRPSHLTLIGSL